MAISGVGLVLAIIVARRAGQAEVVQVMVGGWGLFVGDAMGPIGVALVSALGVLAGAAMLPQLPGERPPFASVMLACGLGATSFLAVDPRQAILCLGLMIVALGFALGRGSERREARRSGWLFVAACVPGFILMAWAVLTTAGRAGMPDMQLIRELVAGELAANVVAIRVLTVGYGLLLALPLLPFLAPDLLSRRPMGATVAAYGIGAAAISWLFARCAFQLFPYGEGWDLARRGWVIPALALPSAGLMVAACIARAPSSMVSLALAGQGLWIPLGFATGGRADAGFGIGIALSMAIPIGRAAILAVTSASREVAPRRSEPLVTGLHKGAGVVAALALAVAALRLPWPFHGVWRWVALALLALPAVYLGYRVARFSLAERSRRGRLYAIIGAASALVALVAAVPTPLTAAVARTAERDLGLHKRFLVGPGGMPPPVNAPGAVRPGPGGAAE
jgi:hypothetical protein